MELGLVGVEIGVGGGGGVGIRFRVRVRVRVRARARLWTPARRCACQRRPRRSARDVRAGIRLLS